MKPYINYDVYMNGAEEIILIRFQMHSLVDTFLSYQFHSMNYALSKPIVKITKII